MKRGQPKPTVEELEAILARPPGYYTKSISRKDGSIYVRKNPHYKQAKT